MRFRPLPPYAAGTVAALLLASAPLLANEPRTIADVRVFAIYEPIFTRHDVDLVTRVHPDLVCRGWFKWHNTPDWQALAPLARACRARGVLLQGGITCAALYPGENGMDDAAFRDFACHGTDGEPYPCVQFESGGWYHLSLYNPKVVAYLKQQVHLQLDAGAAGIWYDEIEGYYDWNSTEGYDAYACAAFRDWLIRKYCDGLGWTDTDPRWRTQFGIDLAKHGGSIRTFDYLRHLRETPGRDGRPLAADPPQGRPQNWAHSANPLFREWGYAWNRAARGTFRFDTADSIFADILADANRYAQTNGLPPLISTYNHNGTARPGAAFLQPHNGAQPPLCKGRLDGRVSYLPYYERVIADAAPICPGLPVVFFVDWPGETDRMTAMSLTDQLNFFHLYIPEAYAAGGEFALPLRGYTYHAETQGTLGALARLADFYRAYAPFLRGSQPATLQPADQNPLVVRVRTSVRGTVVHLINHAFAAQEVWPLTRTNLCVTIPWSGPAPAAAFAVSPDFPEQRPVRVTPAKDALTLEVGTLARSALVLLPTADALRPVTGRAADGTHLFAATGRALAIARDGRFTLWLMPDAAEIVCLETGERLPARDGIQFAPPPAGPFADGLALDAFGIPERRAEIASGTRRWLTDPWGRFRLPLAQLERGEATVRADEGPAQSFRPAEGFTAWRFSDAHRTVGDFEASTGQFWANWPDRKRTPGVIDVAHDTRLGRPALRCRFAADPHVSWSNVNSPGFPASDADAVELTFCGEGAARTVQAVLQAMPHFYRTPLTLSPGWTTRRIPFTDFRDERGQPFDPEIRTDPIAFQLASPDALPATVWLQSVSLVNRHPTTEVWHNNAAFDAAEDDHLRNVHPPLPPPPAVAARRALVRFNGPAPDLLANWDGKRANDPKPMVIIERPVPKDAPPFLRVTLPAGACAWGNANIPLPTDLRGQDGLALRIRAKPAETRVTLALHTSVAGQNKFFSADLDAGPEWRECVLPWSDFHASDGSAFAANGAHALLQICRTGGEQARECVVDVERVDAVTFSAAPSSAFLNNGVTAHRGNSEGFPENTLPAFASALALGADWIELDLHLTKDGQLVISHDSDTGRTGDRTLKIADSTFAQLQTVDVATDFRARKKRTLAQCPPERMPRFEDALRLIVAQHRTRVSIHLKADCAEAALKTIRALQAEPWVGFNDGDLAHLRQVRALAPTVPIFWDRPAVSDIDQDIRTAHAAGFGTLVINAQGLTREKADTIRRAGLRVGVWTVDDTKALQAFLKMGVERVYTDAPARLLDLRRAGPAPR